MAIKKTVSGTTTFLALALPGTAESSTTWMALKMDESSGLRITYADGNDSFDNAATDLTALTYS